ncbi:MAG: ATP-binding cassette domain-containing protein [Proteobacteria bacterium]|nr:ATP-binding cassette domain-containing protein [Pseudomonadota bacterium]
MGELLAFLSAQALMFSPWTELMNHLQVQQDASVQYQRVQDFFDHPPAQVATKVRSGPQLKGKFHIQSLSLDTGKGTRILDDISLTIEPGKLTVLVGRSGSGKSMLLRCLAGKIRNYGGHILADGQDMKNLTNHEMAASMGVVSQAPYMFDGTLQDNLLYPLHALDPANDPPLDDMILAIQQAGLYPDLLLFGLNRTLDDAFLIPLSQELVQMRRVIRKEASLELADHLDSFEDGDQTPFFPGHTLLENILGGQLRAKDTTATMAWLPRIIPMLMAHDLLETTVSAGLQYRIGSKGERLSGGQRQRLALAAILLKQPRILILDEVGSGLDHHSRARVAQLYDRLKGSHTIIAVEHNLEQINQFDRIAVMDQGQLKETGSFDELMARQGLFHEMITSFRNSDSTNSDSRESK